MFFAPVDYNDDPGYDSFQGVFIDAKFYRWKQDQDDGKNQIEIVKFIPMLVKDSVYSKNYYLKFHYIDKQWKLFEVGVMQP